jgi:predicted Zn-dependent peptidase
VFSRLVNKINSITPAEIQQLACKYLNPDDFWIVTVGQDAKPPVKIQRKKPQIV